MNRDHEDTHGRHHGLSSQADQRYLAISLGLLGAFMVGEVLAAFISGSLALLADAGHMLTDMVALGASMVAARLSARPAGGIWTFGLKRAEILSAAANGVILVGMAAVITAEAVRRLISPPGVEAPVVLGVALGGVVFNLAATAVLGRADRTSLNVRGAFAHILTDLYAFMATAGAGAIILATGERRADPAASLVVAALMVRSAVPLLRDSGRILLQGAPAGVSLQDVRAHIASIDHVLSVHDLHAWTLSSNLPTLSAHVVVDDHCFLSGHAPQILDALQACLGDHFDVEHSTFQLEPRTHAAHEEGSHE